MKKLIKNLQNKKIIFVFFLICASFLGFYNFTSFPPMNGFGFEEFQTGENALQLIQNHNLVQLEHIVTNSLPSIAFLFFEPNNFTLRLPFVIIGIISVPLFYLLLLEIYSPFIAFSGAFLFLVSRWHIFSSRTADELFTGVSLTIFLLFFFFKAIKTNKFLYFILSGIFLGLISYEYLGYRLSLIFIPLATFYYLYKKIKNKTCSKFTILNIIIFFSLFLIIASPLFLALTHGDDSLVEGLRRHGNDKLGGGFRSFDYMLKYDFFQILPSSEIIKERTLPTVSVFMFQGSEIPELGGNIPLLDPVSGILFLLAYLYSFVKLKKPLILFFSSWLTIALIISTFFPINFYVGRFSVIMPFIFILICFLLNDIYLFFKKMHLDYIFIYISIIILFFVTGSNLYTLFVKQLNDSSVLDAFSSQKESRYCELKQIKGWICKYSNDK